MIDLMLLSDLVVNLPSAVRLQRLVSVLRERFRCGAVAVLRLEENRLRPMAVDGLVHETLGRRFVVAQHPRLAAILSRRDPTRFEPGSDLPDPYDGLLDSQVGEPLPVHDCMGISLYVEGVQWGVLTLDALDAGAFSGEAMQTLKHFGLLAEAAIRVTRLEQELQGLRLVREPHSGDGVSVVEAEEEIVGQSEALQALLHELTVVADSELPVLLLGETGVGKELFARRVHVLSRRADRPMVHVNCAALPESLAESELFGHVKGAFSGAISERPGRFEAADGGTLFLDEVGELPLSVQAKLLRALQNGEIQRLGSDRPRRVNVRVIAATNRNLHDSVRDGDFRADLYHRLSVYPVPIPPLRERGNDVLLLAGRFLELNRARLGLRSLRLSPDAEVALCRYFWPGNVRELEHVISRAVLKAVSRGATRTEIISLGAALLDLDEDVARQGAGSSVTDALVPSTVIDIAELQTIMPLKEVVERSQRHAIQQALGANQGNWASAARMLNVDASNLHKLAYRLGLK